MSNIIDENVLLKQLQTGDQNAFDTLFRQYYKYLVVVAYRYVGDDHQARDIVQDVFMDLWKRREKINIQQSIKAFLRRAVVNNCLSILKKNKKTTTTDEVNLQLTDEHNKVDGLYEYKELEAVINEAIESLPERCQLVFKMSRHENLSHKAIAEQLNISTKTIENQMTKALKVIRGALKKYELLIFIILFTIFL